MSANTESLRGRQVRLPTWVVVGTALALAAALAVVTLSSRDTTTPARAPTITVESVAGSPDDVAEIAALKAARTVGTASGLTDQPPSGPTNIAGRGAARRFENAGTEIAWLKARLATSKAFGRHS